MYLVQCTNRYRGDSVIRFKLLKPTMQSSDTLGAATLLVRPERSERRSTVDSAEG